jgi:RNA polymerase sigma factor (sigma-70 family)
MDPNTRSLRSTRTRLGHEWRRLNFRPSSVRIASAWQITSGPPSCLDDVLTAVGAGGDSSPAADLRLRRLVAIARTDDLAARVVIERILPGLLKLTSKYRRSTDSFEELLAAAWIAVRTYNPERSPSNIAVALLSDAEYAAYRRRMRRREHIEPPTPLPEQLAAVDERHAADELAALLDDAEAAGMRADDVDLVRRLAAETSTEELAHQLHVTSRTIRNRRGRAVAALRELALSG